MNYGKKKKNRNLIYIIKTFQDVRYTDTHTKFLKILKVGGVEYT